MNKKRIVSILIALAILTTLVPIVSAATEEDPFITDLIAGQHIDVGEVQVWNDAEYLYVKYLVDESGWEISETHLMVAATLDGIPQTLPNKQGKGGENPIPGQFDYVTEHDPWVTEYTYQIPLTWDPTDNIVIAAHAVVMDVSCYETGVVYGIQRNTGDVYGVDVISGESWLEFTMPDPPEGNNASPNGLAYDELNGYFYYTDYQLGTTPDTLYFWDGVGQQVAGQVASGTVACGDMFNGKYYYIPTATDDLYEITFNPDGTISTDTKLDDISDDLHKWSFSGDIAVKDNIVYGWGLCSIDSDFEYFLYDMDTDVFTIYTPSYQSSLQLAFGSNGELYGHRSGGVGEFFIIDTSNGEVTMVTPTPDPVVLYTDTASGMICTPTDETAWGAGSDFDGANWATYFNYFECYLSEPIKIVTIDPKGAESIVTYLEESKTYQFKAEGQMHWTGSWEGDAMYWDRPDNTLWPGGGYWLTKGVDFYNTWETWPTDYDTTRAEYNIDWGAYNPEHIYYYNYEPTVSGDVTFRQIDNVYTDNSNVGEGIKITIYEWICP